MIPRMDGCFGCQGGTEKSLQDRIFRVPTGIFIFNIYAYCDLTSFQSALYRSSASVPR